MFPRDSTEASIDTDGTHDGSLSGAAVKVANPRKATSLGIHKNPLVERARRRGPLGDHVAVAG